MILRNGILSTLRAKGRTVLFTALILLMCLALTLGAGMWAYCSAQLRALDESYTSIALVEYMGADYPDEHASDIFAREAFSTLDQEAIAALEGVELWEEKDSSLAYIDGFKRQGDTGFSDYAVIEFTQISEMYAKGAAAVTEEELPASFLAYDNFNYEARLRTADFDSGFVPYFIMDGDIYQLNYKNGYRVYFEEDQLPETYIISARTAIRYVNGDSVQTVAPPEVDSIRMGIDIQYDHLARGYISSGNMFQGYTALTNQIIYARDIEGTKVMIIEPGDFDFKPEKGQRYVIHGKFVESANSNMRFAIADFYEGCETLPYQESKDTEISPIFYEYADYYSRANNFVTVEASSDIASLEAFQQDIFHLVEGRFPERGEKGVCVVSGDIARQMELSIGDSIDVGYFDSDPDDRFDVSESGRSQTLEVVGIATMPEEYYGYLWASDAEGGFGGDFFGYQLGRALLDNASARETVEAMQAICPEGVRVTLFDQGYSSAAEPLETMGSTATAVTLASALGALAVVFLFAYLFVGRQKETVNVLVSLGTPGAKISLWLLSGAVLISGVASAAGAILGGAVLGKIIALAFSVASSLYAVDSRYSESAVGMVREAAGLGETPAWPAIAAFAFIFIMSLVLCYIFLRLARKQTAPKKGRLYVRVPKGGTSLALRGPLRFAMLSARRGGWRSGVVPAVALVLSIFLGILASASAGWGEQMDSLYRDAEISGRAVSTNGRRSTGLVVSTENARTLWKSGMLEEISVSLGFNYWFPEDMPSFGTGSFAEETRQAWISNQPEIVALNGFEAAPEFIYSGIPEVEWLEGWNESFLSDGEACASLLELMNHPRSGSVLPAEKEATPIPCLVPESIMERFGLELGDSRQICIQYLIDGNEWDNQLEMLIVGSFPQAGADANIYAPLSLWCDEDWIVGEEDILPDGQRVNLQFFTNLDRDQYFYFHTRFATCVFTLSDASRLDELRDYLSEEEFTRVDDLRSNRTTVLLFDGSFVETVGGLGRYISFSQLLFPVLFALMAVLGFIISWLMVNARRMEFAILRGLGASRKRVFLSFFLEQALLCLGGGILGSVILCLATGSLGWWWAVALFALCYLLGAALSVLAVGRTHLMSLLSERE